MLTISENELKVYKCLREPIWSIRDWIKLNNQEKEIIKLPRNFGLKSVPFKNNSKLGFPFPHRNKNMQTKF